MSTEISLDALVPAQMADKAVQVGIKKSQTDTASLLVLAILAGAFIALGAVFATSVTAGTAGELPFGIIKLITGLSFTLGLILVIVGGAELFTGNNLITMAYASGKVTMSGLLRNWVIVYAGNFVGAIATAVLLFLTKQYMQGGGAVGLNALNVGEAKTSLDFGQAVALGIMCNALVCMAVWLCYGARSTTDKILSIIPPIAAFVAAGFEHSVANMYYIPVALLIKNQGDSAFFTAIGKAPGDFANLTWENFFVANLLPVTIGNIIGGAVMVGLIYWFIYLRKSRTAAVPAPGTAAPSAASK
ncbi:MAG: formate transporter FocA [Chloroflexi bacterium]|jgi:formate/nitrite transporter|nr:formate transporter FocA [Chloroflexota bacterium]